MRGPPERRSPAAGRRDRASILITGKVDNPLISTPGAGLQPFRTPRPARQTRTIDVEPNWRRLDHIIDDMIADLEREST